MDRYYKLVTMLLSVQIVIAMATEGNTTHKLSESTPVHLHEEYYQIRPHFQPEFQSYGTNQSQSGGQNTSRNKRSNPDDDFSAPTDICELTEGELSGLADVLKRAASELSEPSNSRVTRSTDSNATNCSKLIATITDKAKYIITQVELLKNSSIVDVHQFEALKSQLAGQLSEFKRTVDNLKMHYEQKLARVVDQVNAQWAEIHQQNMSRAIDKVNVEWAARHHHTVLMQERNVKLNEIRQRNMALALVNFNANLAAFQRKVSDVVRENSKLRAEYREQSIKLCIYQIKSGEASLAADEFKKLNDNALLSRITKDSYRGNPEYVAKIVAFVGKLQYCTQAEAVYTKLYEEMNRYGHLSSPEILTFMDSTNRICKIFLADINAKLHPLVDSIISAWAGRVRSRDTYQIFEFTRRQLSTNVMLDNLPNLIRASYSSSLNNFDAVLSFIYGMAGYMHVQVGFDTLLTEMKKNSAHLYSKEMVRLAYKVKRTMEFSNFATPSVETQNAYSNLKNAFPENIVGLIWNGDSCTLRNVRHYENLYAAVDHFNFNSDSRKVFTWVKGVSIQREDWKFETNDEAATFRLKNVYFNEYLFASSYHKKDEGRRWVFTWRKGETVHQGYWKLTPLDNEAFTIENSWHDEYLYADGNMQHGYDWHHRRGVFTWRKGEPVGPMWKECRWIIRCQST